MSFKRFHRDEDDKLVDIERQFATFYYFPPFNHQIMRWRDARFGGRKVISFVRLAVDGVLCVMSSVVSLFATSFTFI